MNYIPSAAVLASNTAVAIRTNEVLNLTPTGEFKQETEKMTQPPAATISGMFLCRFFHKCKWKTCFGPVMTFCPLFAFVFSCMFKPTWTRFERMTPQDAAIQQFKIHFKEFFFWLTQKRNADRPY